MSERHYISIHGIVRVGNKEHNGFWATHYKLKQNRGHFFVYMGHRGRSPISDNLIRQKHKMVKLSNIPEK